MYMSYFSLRLAWYNQAKYVAVYIEKAGKRQKD
jgi:hypothetical protein